MASSTISHHFRPGTQHPDIQALLPPVSTESDDSGQSDTEEPELPISQDLDYQYSLPPARQPSIPQPQTSFELYGLTLPKPPARPSHFKCEPAWHYDTARSPINSDGEVSNNSDSDDSEEGTILESSSSKKGNTKRKKLAPGYLKNQEAYKRRKTAEKLEKTQKVEVEEGANFHALRRRSRGRQPPPIFQRPPLQIQRLYSTFTLQQVQNGLIIRDSRQRTLVHLFPLATLSPNLLETLSSSFQEYDNHLAFPNYNYTHKRGDYQVRILGCWFKSGRFLQPYMTAHYRGPHSGTHYKRLDNPYYVAAKKFQKANRNLFQLIEDLIKNYYPDLWELYSQIRVPSGCHKFAGLFAAVVINKMVQTKVHKDLGDIKGGICVIICWGKFTGGELVFTELTTYVPFPAGSILMFRSSIISHYNMPVDGERYSMVFMTDKNLYKWSNSFSQ